MSFSSNLDPSLGSSVGGQWLWTPHGAASPPDNSKGLYAVNCNLNQNVTGSDVILTSTWINNFGLPIRITRLVSNIGTEFRQQILAALGASACPGSGEGAPIAQYEGSILLQEMKDPSTKGDHLNLLSHGPSVFNQFQTLDWDKDVCFDAGQEPIVQPGDGLTFLVNNFWPYAGSWNLQYDFVAYFKF